MMSDVVPAASGPMRGAASSGNELDNSEGPRSMGESRSPLGPPDRWPASLRALLPLMHASQLAIRAFWGVELIVFYNDAYRPAAGANHPHATGSTIAETFPEELSTLEPSLRRALSGESFADPERQEYVSYIPIHSDDGAVGGVVEITCAPKDKVSADRELSILRQAADAAVIGTLRSSAARLMSDLERTTKELDSFSYSVSHDVRAPLRSIDGFSQALIEDHAERLNETGQQYLRRVRAAAQRIDNMIDDLLLLSRVGRTPMQRHAVNLSEISVQVIERLQRRKDAPKIAVQIETGIVADADAPLVRVVLESLLGNAWKFVAQATAPQISFGLERRSDGPVYFVRDNGAGFDMTYVGRLFAPFQRLHTDTQFPGRGIGLATVRRIVSRHGGNVWAEGCVGQGATIYFTLAPTQSETKS